MTERGAGAAAQGVAGDLLDVNVWLALAIEEHPHHPAAAAYGAAHAGTARLFCRTSAMSFVRLLTRPRLMADKPLALSKAWALYCRFAASPCSASPRALKPTSARSSRRNCRCACSPPPVSPP